MSDLKIVLLHDPADQAWADEAKAALEGAIAKQIAIVEDRPVIEARADLAQWPRPDELGPLSMVVLAIPGRPLTPEEERAADAYVAGALGGDLQLLPVAPAASRARPPAPFAHLVSARLHGPIDAAQLAQVTTLLLNQMALRVAGRQRSIFVSYRTVDGAAISKHVADELVARGYQVWRDELPDPDGLPMIAPGSEAQKTIERAILQHGFVLVIDTPAAPDSAWVQEEVTLAIGHMLPVVPLVIEDAGPRVRLGGRFEELTQLQREVRRDQAALIAGNLPAVLDGAFFDELERTMSTVLLEHLRSRRRLLRDAERRFRASRFTWTTVDPDRLLFRADLDCDSAATPDVMLRLLVLCSPYEVVLDSAVASLRTAFSRQLEHCQFGIVIHQSNVYGPQLRKLLRDRGGHLLVLRSDKLDALGHLINLPPVAP